MAPDQLYRAICIACHDVDGRGTIVRKAMPTIPDLTDAKWQATRSDAELFHSVLEGKGQLMLPMKDKFALAHTDPKEMVAFMRSFQSGKQVIAAGAPAQASAVAALRPARHPGLSRRQHSTPLAAPASCPIAAASPVPTPARRRSPRRSRSASPAQGLQPPALHLVALGPTPLPHGSPSDGIISRECREVAGRPREFYSTNCIACHGPDGRGSAIRVAMPADPRLHTPEWQTSREQSPTGSEHSRRKGPIDAPLARSSRVGAGPGPDCLRADVRSSRADGYNDFDKRIRRPVSRSSEAMGRVEPPGPGPVSSLSASKRPALALRAIRSLSMTRIGYPI